MKQRLMILTIICITSFFLLACTNGSQADEEVASVTPIEIQYVENERHGLGFHEVVYGWDYIFWEEVMYYALGEHGEYFFTPGEWTEEFMRHIIAVSEDSIKFAKDWLGYDGDELIRAFYGHVAYDTPTNPDSIMQKHFPIAVAYHGDFLINIPKEAHPCSTAHEAVHAILRLQERRSNFPHGTEHNRSPLLEEGLCTVIDYLFVIETEYIYSEEKYGVNKENIESESFLHTQALQTEHQMLFEGDMDKPELTLMSYDTAASFIFYLLEHRGTKDDFMQVFDDVNLMEEVYGASMGDIIAEWLEFLGQY